MLTRRMKKFKGIPLPELPDPYYWNILRHDDVDNIGIYVEHGHSGWWHWWWYAADAKNKNYADRVVAESPEEGRENTLAEGVTIKEAIAIMHNCCLLGVYGD